MEKATSQMIFNGIHLRAGKVPTIHRQQFLRSLVNNMKSRLLESTTASNDKCKKLINQSKYLYINNIPEDSLFTFENNDVEEIAEQFGLNGRLCIRAFREFNESKGKVVSADFQQLLTAENTIPVSTAKCERNFSGINVCMSPQRARLQTDHLSTLLFIKLVGPPLSKFNPEEYVRT